MKLVALLSWYDEPVEELVNLINSLPAAGVTDVVAVDGAYALYPDGEPRSAPEQQRIIVLACQHHGLGVTVHVPQERWAGNEVQKRTFLFALGWAVADEGDWFWVLDADEVITEAPANLHERLQACEHDAVEVEVFDTMAARARLPHWPERFAMRQLFRAQPIHLETNHITYMTADGRRLWGYDGNETPAEPCLDLTDCIVVEHRPDRRSRDRLRDKLVYYAQRDAERVERGQCQGCGRQASKLVPKDWRWTDIGPVAEWMEACDACAEAREAINRVELEALGIDPDSVAHENRNGRIPERVR